MMKAISVAHHGGPEVLKLVDLPIPVPGPRQVVVKLLGAGVNPVDTYRRQGAQNYARTGPWPYTPGSDGAGIIHTVGPEVVRHQSIDKYISPDLNPPSIQKKGATLHKIKAFAPGNRVYLQGSVSGTYAQYSLCDEDQVDILPDNISFDQGAGLWTTYATAYQAIYHAGTLNELLNAHSGKVNVFIHGASGGVGTACVQWLRQVPGVTIIGTAGTSEGADLLKREGVHHVLNHRNEDYMKELLTLSGGKGPELILEMLANVNLDKDLKAVSSRGKIVVIGSRGPIEITPRDFMSKRCVVTGLALMTATPEEIQDTKTMIRRHLAEGYLNVVIGKTYKLADAAQAHIDVMSNAGSRGKLILHPFDE